jgi:hypothetical protein
VLWLRDIALPNDNRFGLNNAPGSNRIHVIEIFVPTQYAIESSFDNAGLATGDSRITVCKLLIYARYQLVTHAILLFPAC